MTDKQHTSDEPKSLQEQVRDISAIPVTTAISNLQTEYLSLAKRLRGYSIQVHGSILNMLQTEFQLRQDETKNAIEEHKFKLAVKQRAENDAAQAKLEADQKAIAEANRPKLVQTGGNLGIAASPKA